MAAAKHTPGPWITFQPRGDGSVPVRTDGLGITICYVHDGAICDAVANARLIAASPDFLTASEALLVAWEKLIEALPQDDRIEEIEFEEFMAIRSAVAKARGINSWEVGKYLADKAGAA